MEDFGIATATRTERQSTLSLTSQNDRDHLSAKFGHLKVRAVSLDSVLIPASGRNKSIHTNFYTLKPAQSKMLLSATDTDSSSDDFKVTAQKPLAEHTTDNLQPNKNVEPDSKNETLPAKNEQLHFKQLQATDVTSALKELNLEATENELGEGSYGVVKEWVTNDGKSRAVKRILPKSYLTDDADLETGEVCALDFGTHPNLVKVHTILIKKKDTPAYAAIESTKPLTDSIKKHYHIAAIISDKASGTDLYNQLIDKDFKRTNHRVTNLGKCVADGIGYLNGKGMIYRDIKPENIIFDPEKDAVKIVDYGFVKDIKALERTGSLKGTEEYMAPEIWSIYHENTTSGSVAVSSENPSKSQETCLLSCLFGCSRGVSNASSTIDVYGASTYGIQYDAWGLGCLLFECITDKTPVDYYKKNKLLGKNWELEEKATNIYHFSKLKDNEKKKLILKYSALIFSEKVNPALIDITVKLLRNAEKDRMTIDDAKKQLSKLLLKLGKK